MLFLYLFLTITATLLATGLIVLIGLKLTGEDIEWLI